MTRRVNQGLGITAILVFLIQVIDPMTLRLRWQEDFCYDRYGTPRDIAALGPDIVPSVGIVDWGSWLYPGFTCSFGSAARHTYVTAAPAEWRHSAVVALTIVGLSLGVLRFAAWVRDSSKPRGRLLATGLVMSATALLIIETQDSLGEDRDEHAWCTSRYEKQLESDAENLDIRVTDWGSFLRPGLTCTFTEPKSNTRVVARPSQARTYTVLILILALLAQTSCVAVALRRARCGQHRDPRRDKWQ